MIGVAIAKALSFFGKIPWQIWVGLALILAAGLSYCHGHSTGYEQADAKWQAKLEKAEADAEAKAKEAAQSADEQQQERATEFEAEQESLREIIDEAEDTGSNPLDELMRSLW